MSTASMDTYTLLHHEIPFSIGSVLSRWLLCIVAPIIGKQGSYPPLRGLRNALPGKRQEQTILYSVYRIQNTICICKSQ